MQWPVDNEGKNLRVLYTGIDCGEMALAYSVISGGETASEFLQPDTGLLQHVRVLMALKLHM